MPRAHDPTVQKISSTLAATAKHHGPAHPRVTELRSDLEVARNEHDVREAVAALVPDAPELPDSVVAVLRAARRRSVGEAIPA